MPSSRPVFRSTARLILVVLLVPVPALLISTLLSLAFAAAPLEAPQAAQRPQVAVFSPQGTVKQVRQATARFTLPMTALGDPRLEDPFTVDCPLPGKGRWADGRNWVYDFDEDLPAGVRCRFTLKPGLKTLDGGALEGPRTFAFDTGGPAIVASFPYEGWEEIDEEQIFLLRLDAPASTESIRERAYCVIEGVSERVPLQVLQDDARKNVLAQRAALGYAYYNLLWKRGAYSSIRVRDRSVEQAEDRITVVQCNRRLPSATQVRLVWGAGIATATPGAATNSGVAQPIETTQDQSLAFRVRPAFTAQVECARANTRSGCILILPVNVNFSAPVPRDKALAVRLTAKDGTVYKPVPPRTDKEPTLQSLSFKGPFPDSSALIVSMPTGLVDDAGRPLENAARFPLELRIDEYPPLAKFSGEFGILEASEGGVLPVTLRNVEAELPARRLDLPAKVERIDADPAEIARWMRRVQLANEPKGDWERDEKNDRSVWRDKTGLESVFGADDSPNAFAVRKPLGDKPAEVVGIPLKLPGFYVVELESRKLGASLLGRDAPRYVSTAALVTHLAVHFKWGREASRVWVTSLDDGKPVADATVTVNDYCGGELRWQGRTDRDGIAAIRESLGNPHEGDRCEGWSPHPLIVVARKDGDFSLALSAWSRGIGPNDFGLQTNWSWNTQIFHTVLDRPLLRAGETVSMKHFLRRHHMNGIAAADSLPSTRKVTISHLGSNQKYQLSVQFGADGTAEQQWTIPKEAKLGDYAIEIEDLSPKTPRMRGSGRFKVEEFRLPTMRATVQGPGRPLVNPREVVLDLHVAYLSGGGAGGIPVTLRTVVEPRPVQYPGYEDYQFGGNPVKEGVIESNGGRFDYDFEGDEAGRDSSEEGASDPAGQKNTVRVTPLTLDAQGTARVTIPDLPKGLGPAQLTAELEYADANGEWLTSSGRVRLLPSTVSLGIRREGWVASPKQMRFRVVALDLDGKPVPRHKVAVSLYQSSAYSYRKRLIGGFYAYDTVRETKKLAKTCTGETNAQGLLVCEVEPGASGEIVLRAETRDSQSNLAGATASIWVAGEDDWWFGGTEGDRMDVLPEKKEYESGEKARFQVRMPFRAATALVTVEREGVLRSFVTPLKGRAPTIEVPIVDADSPNVFVSVLAVRGRVARSERTRAQRAAGGPDITATVDLNKPAYRLGLAEIRVGWKPHRLNVRVTPERPTYRVRENAQVRIQVTRATDSSSSSSPGSPSFPGSSHSSQRSPLSPGSPLPAGTEVAIAAVDEALLDLAPNPSWALLDAMMGKRGIEVWTSTAQMQVVGKRHYGRKAVPHGGGGGRERSRELFDSLLVWKPRVVLDANGEATVSIPLNDSLSSFRIAAIASGGEELFGTGTATVATTQDLMLLSGLPPLVREGDRYAATFTVRNTSQGPLPVEVTAQVKPAGKTPLPVRKLEIPAGEARDVTWEFTAPVGTAQLQWSVAARQAGAVGQVDGAVSQTNSAMPQADSAARDAIKIAQTVIPAYPVRTYQATIAQLTPAQPAQGPSQSAMPPASQPNAPAPMTIATERPKGAVPGRGGLEITLQARLADDSEGIREYMSFYPYSCLEQRASRAIALRERATWDALMKSLPAYMDRDGLLKYFPADWLPGEDSLTAYVLEIGHEAGWEIPAAQRQRAIQALTGFVEGRIVRHSALPTADLAIRKLAAIEALSRYNAARPNMLDSITIEPNLWPTSAVIDWLNILRRLPDIPGVKDKQKAAEGALRARLNFQGTIMTFSTARSDVLWWLMISEDSNAVRMLLSVLDRDAWREDIPRLVRGALGRQKQGHWNTTVANAWGVLALDKFSAAFESTPVAGVTSVQYGVLKKSVKWDPSKANAAAGSLTAGGEQGTTTRQGFEIAKPTHNPYELKFPWQDKRQSLAIDHAGTGKPWVMVRATAALPLAAPFSTGYKIHRTVTPITQKTSGRWGRGDVARVRLELEAQSDMSWVVVEDPVPGGATILGSGLGGQSQLMTRGEKREGWAWAAFEERKFDSFRSYYRFVPKGKWTVEYTLRLNNPGTFLLPATRVEAMYAPEMLGEAPNAAVTVHE